MLEMIERNEIWLGEDGNNMPRRKKFLREVVEVIAYNERVLIGTRTPQRSSSWYPTDVRPKT